MNDPYRNVTDRGELQLMQSHPDYGVEIRRIHTAIERGTQPIPPAWGDQGTWWEIIGAMIQDIHGGGDDVSYPALPGGGLVGGQLGPETGIIPPGAPDDPDRFYDDPTIGQGPAGTPVVMAGTVVRLSSLVPRIPSSWLPAVGRLASQLGMNVRVMWSQLPGWLKPLLTWLGVEAGIELLIDWGEGDIGLIPIGGGGVGSSPPRSYQVGDMVEVGEDRYQVASMWHAAGWPFYRFTDGHQGVMNKHGVWKVWKPRKPVVLFATGPSDIRDVLKADSIIEKTLNRAKVSLRRRGWAIKRHREPSK